MSTSPDELLGPNSWLVDEYRDAYNEDPSSVSEEWREYFSNAEAPRAADPAPPPAAPAPQAPAAAPATKPAPAPASQDDSATKSAPAPKAKDEDQSKPKAKDNKDNKPKDNKAKDNKAKDNKDKATSNGGRTTPDETSEPGSETKPIRGISAAIAENMEASLAVPTATSVRDLPAKLLEVNRGVINGHLGRTRGGKVSFTHIIGYAIVRAIADHHPDMAVTFSRDDDGKPQSTHHSSIGLGLAIDVERRGERVLMVPVIKGAESMDFKEFVDAYNDVVDRTMDNKLKVEDFQGALVSLTNPGTIGTVLSVPRLMSGQSVIVGVGKLGYPAAYQGADAATIANLGISKVLTVTSTYDHRVIQGAESGSFLKTVESLLLGGEDFYRRIFADIGVPYVSVEWRQDTNPADHTDGLVHKQMSIAMLVNMYRSRGHLIAELDPLSAKAPEIHEELDPVTYGLTIWDLDREFQTGAGSIYASVGGEERLPLGEILRVLRNAYCRTIGVEFMHIQDVEEKRWIQEQMEGKEGFELTGDEQIHILDLLNKADALEQFLGTKFLGQKRFGLEGAESAIPIIDEILTQASARHMEAAVMGMAHRGRLNVLVNIVGKRYQDLFGEFEQLIDEDAVQGSGDVKYHLGQVGEFKSLAGDVIKLELAANPSHLETVDPVVAGIARAKMDQVPKEDGGRYPVLPLLVHGDAAFAGQGVVAETLNLSSIKGYRVGGTIHLVINNQLGFTTPPESARSSEYPTDVAKMVQAPIFHVNGNDPEACVRVARLAFEYRRKFEKDVVIDMVCYRKHGHNEGDDPSYTQPIMYQRIDNMAPVRELYTESLVGRGHISLEQAEQAAEAYRAELTNALESTREAKPADPRQVPAPPKPTGVIGPVPTAVPREELDRIFEALNTVPDDFTIHPKLAKQFETRRKMFDSGEVDWSLGEAFAFGSLLAEGTPVRLAGQDSRRGTFSQRHAALVDYHTGEDYVPLSALTTDGSELWIYDSLLSEYAALGFEYGYSVENKDALVMWEAQFGDFVNGASIIIDQYLVAAEDKWKQTSDLVLLLPHGYEGQGPEHSSARIERFLILAAEDNIQLCNVTTAAQYFHLLRRQIHREGNKPLIIFTPKSGLRAKSYRSPVEELTSGHFHELLPDDSGLDPESVTRVVLASGKVAHDAIEKRDELGVPMAVARVEQLFPWPYKAIYAELERYPNCSEIVWLQEEPENMGPWNGIKGRLYEAFEGRDIEIRRVSRVASGSPATGSALIHRQEQEEILNKAFGDLPAKDRWDFN
ncbi:MAG: multifunctional oxoglutarate decarboxylase/oxoglutarate dehydrogenase thiamine pyrophosphate-binding subunit/dihydrolipoyllysine-residue succinyltransferase subunit [Microthrixaceae bacterium]